MTVEDLDRLPTIHYTQIAEPPPHDRNYQELQTFRRELPRLLVPFYLGNFRPSNYAARADSRR